MDYSETLENLYRLRHGSPDVVLARLPARLDNLAPGWRDLDVVHVVGTSGKGSTALFLSSILRRRYRVGVMTSPHVLEFTERISIDGVKMPEDFVIDAWSEISRLGPFTFQEAMLCMALMYFILDGVEIAVLEAGRGGRRDPTSVVHGLRTALTCVRNDHIPTLGTDVLEVAMEKAGIVRGGTVWTYETDMRVMDVIARRCSEVGARLCRLSIIRGGTGTEPEDRGDPCERNPYLGCFIRNEIIEIPVILLGNGYFRMCGIQMRVKTPGEHQVLNAAVSASISASFGLKPADIAAGIETAVIPFRIHDLGDCIVDISHNPHEIMALARTLKEMEVRPYFLIGVAEGKNLRDMLEPLCSMATGIIATRARYRGMHPEKIARMCRDLGTPARAILDPREAYRVALSEARSLSSRLVVTGTTYLLEDILRHTSQNKVNRPVH